MSDNTNYRDFEVDKEIYHTQWTNIRHHWEQTFEGIKYLSILISLAVVPLKFLESTYEYSTISGSDPHIRIYLKIFVGVVIGLMGINTFLNQLNHYYRSKQARTVVINIEKKWNLYDTNETFIYQDPTTKYAYSKFAGGEKRLTQSKVQFIYIALISLTGILFVIFA